MFENCGNCGGGNDNQVEWIFHVQLDVQPWSQSEEDLSGQVQFHGFSQFLWIKPGPLAWAGDVSITGVDRRDISCHSDFEKNPKIISLNKYIEFFWLNFVHILHWQGLSGSAATTLSAQLYIGRYENKINKNSSSRSPRMAGLAREDHWEKKVCERKVLSVGRVCRGPGAEGGGGLWRRRCWCWGPPWCSPWPRLLEVRGGESSWGPSWPRWRKGVIGGSWGRSKTVP